MCIVHQERYSTLAARLRNRRNVEYLAIVVGTGNIYRMGEMCIRDRYDIDLNLHMIDDVTPDTTVSMQKD